MFARDTQHARRSSLVYLHVTVRAMALESQQTVVDPVQLDAALDLLKQLTFEDLNTSQRGILRQLTASQEKLKSAQKAYRTARYQNDPEFRAKQQQYAHAARRKRRQTDTAYRDWENQKRREQYLRQKEANVLSDAANDPP